MLLEDLDDHVSNFVTTLFAALIHTSGINVSPVPKPYKPGRLRNKELAEYVLKELDRGSKMNTDLGANRDFWRYVDRPIEEVRRELGIPPKE